MKPRRQWTHSGHVVSYLHPGELDLALSSEAIHLTTRQRDVLRLLSDGRSTGEIAAELGLSRATVRNYVAALFDVLGAHSRLQAVAMARKAGLLDA